MYSQASSPLSVRGNGTAVTGSASFKRNTVTARGATTSCPRPAAGSYTNTGASLGQALDAGISNVQQLHSHFNLSLSTSARRNVSSSPTQEETSPRRQVPAPSTITVGFAPNQPTVGFVAPQLQLSPTAHSVPKPSRGLLSRALNEPDQGLTETLYGEGSAELTSSAYFPDVDKTLLHDLQERHTVFHSELVSLAYMLAAKAHAGSLRKDGSSQLSHCVLTSLRLAELGLDAETVAGGLLHEVLRINPMFRSQMEEFLPSSLIQLVDRVTTISEISQLYRCNKEALGEEKMRRMLLAMEDVKAMLIKLACRAHNMKTISALSREKQISMAQETLDIFSVVANRLGVWSLKAELEDAAFAMLHPEEYEALKSQVAKRQDPDALEATVNKIKDSLDAQGVQYEDISGRPKSLYGIWTKMKADNIASLDRVYDVTALRVVVTNKHDCYRALRCVQETYRTMSERSKDYIKGEKKANGYQSLHETVFGAGGLPVEVQIRTHKMHYIAEYGFAAHWKYKEKLSNEDEWLDKEVQYKKWLTQYKLGLHDKKVRASGAPQRETALQSLGMHLINGTPGSGGTMMPGVDPFLCHDRFRLEAPTKQCVSVILQTQDSIETREFALDFPAAQLTAELGVNQLPGYVLTVNQRLPSPDYVLRTGDLIQVVPLTSVLSRSPPTAPLMQRTVSHTVLFPGADAPVEVPLPTASLPAPHRLPPLAPALDPSSAPRQPMHPVSGMRAARRRSMSEATVANSASTPVCV